MFANEMMLLRQDLNQFGLDPQEWNLIRESQKVYRIESLIDKNFAFTGRVYRKGTKVSWDQVTLLEI